MQTLQAKRLRDFIHIAYLGDHRETQLSPSTDEFRRKRQASNAI